MAIFGNRDPVGGGGGGGTTSAPTSGGGSRNRHRSRSRNRPRPNNPNNPNNPNRHRHRGGPPLPGPAPDDPGANPYGDLLGTGSEGIAFNNQANALQSGLGLLDKGGIDITPQSGFENEFLNTQMANDYTQFEARRMADPGRDQYRWIDYLGEEYAPDAVPQLPVAPVMPEGLKRRQRRQWRHDPANAAPAITPEQIAARDQALITNMTAAYRDRYARASPTARGYFSERWAGPGRTITG